MLIACATHKFFNQVDCVCDPVYEFKDVLKERIQIHGSKLTTHTGGDSSEKIDMFNKIISRLINVWNAPSVEPLINIHKKIHVKRKKMKILLIGSRR